MSNPMSSFWSQLTDVVAVVRGLGQNLQGDDVDRNINKHGGIKIQCCVMLPSRGAHSKNLLNICKYANMQIYR